MNDLTTMKSRLTLEADIGRFDGPGYRDNKVIAGILLDIRDLLFIMNARQGQNDQAGVVINKLSSDLIAEKPPAAGSVQPTPAKK